MDWTILENNYFVAIFSGLFGIALTLSTQQLLDRRRLFTYFVNHGRIGVSTDDATFGSVRVTWNGNTVPNLFSSTIELINESFKDFENVVIRVFSNDISLPNTEIHSTLSTDPKGRIVLLEIEQQIGNLSFHLAGVE